MGKEVIMQMKSVDAAKLFMKLVKPETYNLKIIWSTDILL
jgi:hypothetical protein